MPDLDAKILTELLEAVGAHLEADRETASILLVGGAALALRGWVVRTTHDVDVIATGHRRGKDIELVRPDLPKALITAVKRVARDFNLPDDWLNTAVAAQWTTGVPDTLSEDIEWRRFGGLQVGTAGRQTVISLKLFAAVDQGPDSVHVQDLLALAPTNAELRRAENWVVGQDAGAEFPRHVSEAIAHVRRHREDR